MPSLVTVVGVCELVHVTDCDCNIITSRFPHSRSSLCFQPSRPILVSSRLAKLVRALRKIVLWIEAVPPIFYRRLQLERRGIKKKNHPRKRKYERHGDPLF